MKKETQPHEGDRVDHENHRLNKREELKTDHPLSEKDQVKEAEERQRKRHAESEKKK